MKCVRPDCQGSYGPEGYCDECGRKAPAGVALTGAVPAGPASGAAAGAGSGPPGAAGPGGVAGSGPAGAAGPGGAVGLRGAEGPASVATGLSAPTGAATGTSGTSAWGVSGRTSRGGRTGRSRSSRGRLGAGLISMPRVPLRDPATAVKTDPQVPENRRFCGHCEKPVGRGRDGQPGLTEGFCPHCGTPYSFAPRLTGGDLVNGRYEILGCLAHGGLGWIYLARDRNISDKVSDRWVVLKGLIDTGDADAMAAAVNERRFLVEVDHPNIVKIHDFAQHPDPRTGTMVGYIVMEYVGGQSLRDILLANKGPNGKREPLPLPQVIAYGLEVLPALGYLHERDILYCDFKPDNVIHAEEQLKLIDLGAVRHVDDVVSAVYGTPGYQAPEVAKVGPSVASDLYTVGRALGVLSFGFPGFSTTYAERLPERHEVPLLVREESFYRFLRRACHPDPARRFGSAAEMAEQLRGVLCEVLSAADGIARPEPSQQFTPERRVFGTEAGLLDLDDRATDRARASIVDTSGASIAAALPLPQVDITDSAAGFLATVGTTDPDELVAVLEAAPVRTVEVGLRLVRARIDRGDVAGGTADLDALAAADPYDWRVDWYRGLAALAGERPADARAAFNRVYDALPGEPAAKLALAAAEERNALAASGEPDSTELTVAAQRYERVWRADHGFVSAAFGLARLRLRQGDRLGCVAILDEVPDSSSQHVTAQVAAVRARLAAELAQLAEADLVDASARLERLRLDVERRAWLAAETLETALDWIRTGRPVPATAARQLGGGKVIAGQVFGRDLSEHALRLGLEQAYRALAKMARDDAVRVHWVDLANTVRPRTWV